MFAALNLQKLKASLEAKFTRRGAAQEKGKESSTAPPTSTNAVGSASAQEDFAANLAQGRKARQAELAKMTTAPTKRQAAHHQRCAFDQAGRLVYCVCVEEAIQASFEAKAKNVAVVAAVQDGTAEEGWDCVAEAYPKAAADGSGVPSDTLYDFYSKARE